MALGLDCDDATAPLLFSYFHKTVLQYALRFYSEPIVLLCTTIQRWTQSGKQSTGSPLTAHAQQSSVPTSAAIHLLSRTFIQYDANAFTSSMLNIQSLQWSDVELAQVRSIV
jgi:hypothetical protein